MRYEMKPLFEQRMKSLLSGESDFEEFNKIIHTSPRNFIRCNTIKIGAEELVKRLKQKWKVEQPFVEHPEIILVAQELKPGELGNAVEHVLGYYYIQEVSSMMPVIALDPRPNEFVLDLFAAPGSKSTQIAAKMDNSGTLIANDLKIERIKILSSNLERCGVSNCIVTKNDAVSLCSKIYKSGYKFDKILIDAPCSGEGTMRSSPKTFVMWNQKVIYKLSRQQKKFLAFAFRCLKKQGVLVYSTCTHAPEENEEIVNFAVSNFPVRVEDLFLPVKCRQGLREWNGCYYGEEVEKACRIYPHDNDSEGFFVAKLTLLEDVE